MSKSRKDRKQHSSNSIGEKMIFYVLGFYLYHVKMIHKNINNKAIFTRLQS